MNLWSLVSGLEDDAHKALAAALEVVDSAKGKAIVDATIELTVAAAKAGLDASLPPFLRPMADFGLDAAEKKLEELANQALDQAAAKAAAAVIIVPVPPVS